MAKDSSDLKALYEKLDKKFNLYFKPERFKTGIIPLDLVTNGGLETGSLIELSGESQTGKSTLVLNLCRIMCEQGHRVLYVDAEGSVKEDLLKGIHLQQYRSMSPKDDKPFLLVPASGYKEVESLITDICTADTNNEYKLIVIDSLTALIADVYLDETKDRVSTEDRVGLDAQMNSKLLKKLNVLKTSHNCIILFVNQTRIDMSGWIASYKASGGQATKFFPDIRLFVKLKERLMDKRQLAIGEKEIPIGANTTIEAHKSRKGLGYIPYPMTIYFGKGVSDLQAYINLLPLINIEVDGKTVPALEQLTSRSYILHTKNGDFKTTNGQGGIPDLIRDNADEVKALVDDYLEEFFREVDSPAVTDEPTNVIAREVKDEEEENLDED